MNMKIYNSLTRRKDEFTPIADKKVGMYVCGPTVYDEPHIGHARSAYNFDVVRRYLAYKGYEVTFVRNVTDVDDKIINKAKEVTGSLPAHQEQGPGQAGHRVTGLIEATREISKKYLDAYHEDMALLGIGRPDKEPKATEYIPKMITFIEALIEKGCAYSSGSDVYFDIKKAKGYGKLSNQNIEKMESGARITPGENKKDPLDFALWKGAKEGEPCWESPWGKGRPGWHIECSVMSSDILGDGFDIHGGGIDLIFPHHENEIAQSEGAGKPFARVWIHNGLLTIKGEKMAKSLGNFISIKDFLKRYRDPDYLKLLFLNTHYRHPVDYTDEKLGEMKAQKERFLILLEKIPRIIKGHQVTPGSSRTRAGTGKSHGHQPVEEFRKKFEEAMDDDFNTPLALAALFDLVTHAHKLMQDKERCTEEEAAELAVIRKAIIDLGAVFCLELAKDVAKAGVDEKQVLGMIGQRNAARARKDFKAADDIRQRLLREYGVILEDTKDGTVWRSKA